METLIELNRLYTNAEKQLAKRRVKAAIRNEFGRRRDEIAGVLYQELGSVTMMRLTSILEDDREVEYAKTDLPDPVKELVTQLQTWLREQKIDV